MNCRRQALSLCLDSAVVVVIHVFNQFLLEVLHGLELLQIQQLTFEQSEEIFHHGIVQTVSLAAHALPDTLFPKHPLILLVLILPTLIRVENQACSGRNLCKRLIQHGGYHAEYRTIRYGVTDQIAAVYLKSTSGFAVTQFLFLHGFNHQFFEFWRISFVCYSFWHSKTPHLLDSISYCLTNGVQFSFAPRLSVYF